jgi:hypothetical protein
MSREDVAYLLRGTGLPAGAAICRSFPRLPPQTDSLADAAVESLPDLPLRHS